MNITKIFLYILFFVILSNISFAILDDFNRGNDTETVGNGWTETEGGSELKIKDNSLYIKNLNPSNMYVSQTLSSGNADILLVKFNFSETGSTILQICIETSGDCSNDGLRLYYQESINRISIGHVGVVENFSNYIALGSQSYYFKLDFNSSGDNQIKGKIWNVTENEPLAYNVNQTLLSEKPNGGKISIMMSGSSSSVSYVDFVSRNNNTEKDLLNVTDSLPQHLSSYSNSIVNFNVTVNSSFNFNATLYINDTAYETNNNIDAGTNLFVSFNHTFISSGDYNYTIKVGNIDIENISTVKTVSIILGNSINISIRNFDNNSYKQEQLSVNLSVTNINGSTPPDIFSNVSIYINGTRNITYFNLNNGNNLIINGSNFSINTTNLGNGTWNFAIEACTNSSLCLSTINYTFTIDTEFPELNFTNPPSIGNSSPFNQTVNITITSRTLNFTNLSVFYSNGSFFYHNFSNGNANFDWIDRKLDVLNFTLEGNYSINLTLGSKAGKNITERTWFYFVNTTPQITIDTPTNASTSTSRTVIFTTTLTHKATNTSCFFHVTDINKNQQISKQNYNCTGGQFTVSSDADFFLWVNATDGLRENETRITITVDSAGQPGAGSGSSGGGGGGTTATTLKPSEGIEVILTNEFDGRSSNLIINKGKSRTYNLKLHNKGSVQREVTIGCIESDQCKWFELPSKISILPNEKKEIKLKINVPLDVSSNDKFAVTITSTQEDGAFDIHPISMVVLPKLGFNSLLFKNFIGLAKFDISKWKADARALPFPQIITLLLIEGSIIFLLFRFGKPTIAVISVAVFVGYFITTLINNSMCVIQIVQCNLT